jgi:hypothetical protein
VCEDFEHAMKFVIVTLCVSAIISNQHFCLQKLKLVLKNVLSSKRYRIRPQQKGVTFVYLHFLTLKEMNVAKETLSTPCVENYKLTVTVCWCCCGAAGFKNLSHVKKRLDR